MFFKEINTEEVMTSLCVTGSYSVPSRSRFRVFVEGEDPSMEDGPRLSPVLPIQQQQQQQTEQTAACREFKTYKMLQLYFRHYFQSFALT